MKYRHKVTGTYLTPEQRNALVDAVTRVEPGEMRVDAINVVVARLHRESPGAFHTEASIGDRIFVHQPRQEVPCLLYFHPFPKES